MIKPQTQYQNLTPRNGYCCSRSDIDNDFYNELMARGGEHILRHSQLFKCFHFETISDLSKNSTLRTNILEYKYIYLKLQQMCIYVYNAYVCILVCLYVNVYIGRYISCDSNITVIWIVV